MTSVVRGPLQPAERVPLKWDSPRSPLTRRARARAVGKSAPTAPEPRKGRQNRESSRVETFSFAPPGLPRTRGLSGLGLPPAEVLVLRPVL